MKVLVMAEDPGFDDEIIELRDKMQTSKLSESSVCEVFITLRLRRLGDFGIDVESLWLLSIVCSEVDEVQGFERILHC